MLILKHIQQLVEACHPDSRAEYEELFSSISPVKFGNVNNWSAAGIYTLAQYQVPQENFLVVLRVECYTVNLTAAAADYGVFEPPPPGTAYWVYYPPDGSGSNAQSVTSPLMNSQLALDADELLIFQGGQNAALLGNLLVSPDSGTRKVRTLVYSYLIGEKVKDGLGESRVLIT